MCDICKKEAFLFDLDGTLLSLEQTYFRIITRLLKDNYNIEISDEKYIRYVTGRRIRDAFISILSSYDIKFTTDEIDKIIEDLRAEVYYLIENNFKETVEIKKGSVEFITLLKEANKAVALVTSSAKRTVNVFIKQWDIFSRFDLIITGDDVKKGKPNPEPYLLAIKKLKVSPEISVVFEDSIHGVQSAKSAGVCVIGLDNGDFNREAIKLVDYSIKDYKPLISQFESCN